MEDNFWSVLDIGTTKVVCLVGRYVEDEGSELVGIGVSELEGVRRGNIVDFEGLKSSVRKAVSEAEIMAGYSVDSVFVGLCGEYIEGFNTEATISVSGKGQIVSEEDVERVMRFAEATATNNERRSREILHVIPISFSVDGQDGIKDPVGMSGISLSAKVHIVTAPKSIISNLYRGIQEADIGVRGIISSHIAVPEAILTEDEKEGGVLVLDLGGGLTNLSLFVKGGIVYTGTVPLGGENITQDIAFLLKVPISVAEDVKIKYGTALQDLVNEEEVIEVMQYGGKKKKLVKRRLISVVIRERLIEILELCKEKVKSSGYMDEIKAGMVITGGGVALSGSLEIAEEVFGLPVRLGVPDRILGLGKMVSEPSFSAAVGLLLYARAYLDVSLQYKEEGISFVDKIRKVFKKILDDFL
jgi:cell division protein FtsA